MDDRNSLNEYVVFFEKVTRTARELRNKEGGTNPLERHRKWSVPLRRGLLSTVRMGAGADTVKVIIDEMFRLIDDQIRAGLFVQSQYVPSGA